MIIQAAADKPDKQIKLLWYCFNLLSDGAMMIQLIFFTLISLFFFYAIFFALNLLDHNRTEVCTLNLIYTKHVDDVDHRLNEKISG